MSVEKQVARTTALLPSSLALRRQEEKLGLLRDARKQLADEAKRDIAPRAPLVAALRAHQKAHKGSATTWAVTAVGATSPSAGGG